MSYFDKFSSEEEEQQPQQQQPAAQEQPSEAMQTAMTAEKKEKPEGLVTAAGKVVDEFFQGILDDTTDPQREEREAATKDIQAGNTEGYSEGQVFMAEQITPKLDAVLGGIKSTFMLPFTAAAALTNQAAPWNERPYSIQDDDPVSDTIFEVTRVLAPSLVLAPATGGLSLPTSLAIESGIETVNVDGAEDLIAGRWLAGKLGELIDDPQLTKDLVEGNTPQAQAILKAYGFAQNYGINWGFTKLFDLFPKAKEAFTDDSAEIARILGEPLEAVEDSLTTFTPSDYVTSLEPAARSTVDTIVPTPVAPEGKAINQAALVQKALREAKGLPPVENSPNNFFTNWSALTPDEAGQAALKQVFEEIPEFELGGEARARIQLGTVKWLTENLGLLDTNARQFLQTYAADFGNQINGGAATLSKQTMQQISNLESFIKMAMGFPVGEERGQIGMAVARYLAEDLGQRLVRSSEQLDNMLMRGEDITDYMEKVYLPLENYTQAVLFPFRRGKRAFYLLGEAQQGRFAREVQSMLSDPYVTSQRINDLLKDNVAPKGVDELEELVLDGTPTGDTIKTLWEAAKEGDKEAFNTLKEYIKNMRYGDANKVLTESELAKNTILEQLKKKQSFNKNFYNIFTLGQIATQQNAAVPTIFRQSLEPLALAGSFNPQVGPKERMYGIGQFKGGWRYRGKAWNSLVRAFATNQSGSGMSRYSAKHSPTLLKEVAEIKRLHAAYQAELADKGTNIFERLAAYNWGLYQIASHHPIANLATRGLMATDEAARVTAGIQNAVGRAYQRAADEPNITSELMRQLEQEEIAKVFKGDPVNAVFRTDTPEGLAAKAVADKISLQKELPTGKDANFIMKFFAMEAEAAKKSPIHAFFSPFMKVAGNAIEQEGENLAATTFPGSQAVLGRMPGFKRYKDIYDAADDTSKLQLEGQLALAQWLSISTIAGIFFGLIEVVPEQPGRDRSSIIVRGGVDGKETAIQFDKFSPFGTPINNIAQVVKQYSEGRIQHDDYTGAIMNVVYGWAAASLNKSVLQGQQQLTNIINYSAGIEPWLLGVQNSASMVFTPGIGREIGAIVNPYETIREERTSIEMRLADQFISKSIGSATNPPAWDIYAYKKEATAPGRTAGYTTSSNQTLNQIAGMFYPGNITTTRYTDPVMVAMRKIQYEVPRDYTRKIRNAELTKQQQSDLRREMQGILMPELAKFVKDKGKSGFNEMWKKYQSNLKTLGPEAAETMTAIQKIYEKFTAIHHQVKMKAAEAAGFNEDPMIRQQIEKAKQSFKPRASARQGMYATAANQSTELANQVRNILDIPV